MEYVNNYIVNKLAENFIDGESLLSLISDIEEFEHLVPQSGLRMKIKKVVQKVTATESSTSLLDDSTQVSKSPSRLSQTSWESHYNQESSLPEDVSTPSFTSRSQASTPNSLKRPLLSEENPEITPKRRPLKKEDDIKETSARLPIPCPLPSVFSPAVQTGLLHNQITGLLKLRMLRECASFFYGLCPSPQPFEYLAMSQALCDKYPTLRDVNTTDGKYWVSVKDYLTQRFRNCRRLSQPTSSTQSYITATIMPKTLCLEAPMSDDVEIKRNEEGLVLEYKKRNPNNVVMRKLLKLTHERRQLDIVSCQVRLTEILEKYPFFSNKAWVLSEFELIVGTEQIQAMKQNWEKYQLPILHACSCSTSSSNNNPLHSLELLDKQFRTGPTVKHTGGFQVYKSSTDINTVVLEKTYSEPRLVLFLSDSENTDISQGLLVAEKNVLLLEITDFTVIDGLISLLAAYYVFHVNYPKSVPAQSLLLFLQ